MAFSSCILYSRYFIPTTIFNLLTQPMELTEQEPETEPVGQGMQTSEPVLPEIVPGTCVCVHV